VSKKHRVKYKTFWLLQGDLKG